MKYRYLPILIACALPVVACDPDTQGSGTANRSAMNATDMVNASADSPIFNVAGALAPAIPETGTPVDANIVTPDGLGTIGIGKPPGVAGAGVLKEEDAQLSDSCRILKSANHPRIYVISDGTRIARITIMSGSPVKTQAGIMTGASEAAVRKAYPELRQEPHDYVDAPAKNLYWEPKGTGAPALRFEIGGDGKVDMIHAGIQPALSYSEGCA